MFSFSCTKEREKEIPFSMAIGKGELMHECIRSAVTRCSLLMVLNLDRMCQCGLLALLWSHIGTLMRPLAGEPRSTTRFLFPYQCPSETILLYPYLMVWNWRVSRAGPMLSCWPQLLYLYYSLLLFLIFSSFCL